jgi:hypothetical protein
VEQNNDKAAQAPAIFIRRVVSGDMVVKSGEDRDRIAEKEGVIVFGDGESRSLGGRCLALLSKASVIILAAIKQEMAALRCSNCDFSDESYFRAIRSDGIRFESVLWRKRRGSVTGSSRSGATKTLSDVN